MMRRIAGYCGCRLVPRYRGHERRFYHRGLNSIQFVVLRCSFIVWWSPPQVQYHTKRDGVLRVSDDGTRFLSMWETLVYRLGARP